MSRKLNDKEYEHPFRVPEGYFDQLTSDIQSRVETKPHWTAAKDPLIRWALVPAMVTLIFIGLWYNISTDNHVSDSQRLLAEVPADAIMAYLENSELTINELVNLTDDPDNLLEADPNFLQGIDLEEEYMEDLTNTINLNELYL